MNGVVNVTSVGTGKVLGVEILTKHCVPRLLLYTWKHFLLEYRMQLLNIGNISRMQILNKMCIEPGAFTTATMKLLDQERLIRARYSHSQQTKEKRKAKQLKRKREEVSPY